MGQSIFDLLRNARGISSISDWEGQQRDIDPGFNQSISDDMLPPELRGRQFQDPGFMMPLPERRGENGQILKPAPIDINEIEAILHPDSRLTRPDFRQSIPQADGVLPSLLADRIIQRSPTGGYEATDSFADKMNAQNPQLTDPGRRRLGDRQATDEITSISDRRQPRFPQLTGVNWANHGIGDRIPPGLPGSKMGSIPRSFPLPSGIMSLLESLMRGRK